MLKMEAVYEWLDNEEITKIWRGKNESEVRKLLGESKIPDIVVATICIQAVIATFGVLANLVVIFVTILGRNKQVSTRS